MLIAWHCCTLSHHFGLYLIIQKGVRNIARLNVGGSISFDGLKLTVVQAVNSASRGAPTGVIFEEGLTVYHAGDTSYFGDMRRLGEWYSIDLACLPIGGNYTMDAEEATEEGSGAEARNGFSHPFRHVPRSGKISHEFAGRVKARLPDVKVLALNPSEVYELPKAVRVIA